MKVFTQSEIMDYFISYVRYTTGKNDIIWDDETMEIMKFIIYLLSKKK